MKSDGMKHGGLLLPSGKCGTCDVVWGRVLMGGHDRDVVRYLQLDRVMGEAPTHTVLHRKFDVDVHAPSAHAAVWCAMTLSDRRSVAD
eukprot:4884538-Lingulodinium_polyedra.AAC.1